jgi:hypothetical protein
MIANYLETCLDADSDSVGLAGKCDSEFPTGAKAASPETTLRLT